MVLLPFIFNDNWVTVYPEDKIINLIIKNPVSEIFQLYMSKVL